MTAKWKWLNPGYRCSECRMKSPILRSSCPFCGAIMTNEEEIWIEMVKAREQEFKNDTNKK